MEELILKISLDIEYSRAREYFKSEIVERLRNNLAALRIKYAELVDETNEIITLLLNKERAYPWLFNNALYALRMAYYHLMLGNFKESDLFAVQAEKKAIIKTLKNV